MIPILLVKKPNGKDRFCLDLRGLNKLVTQDNYPIPDIQYILTPLKNSNVYSKIDLEDGFFQVPLSKNDRHKTAFKIGNETYQFKVMPMGFKNSPGIFQRNMDYIFKEFINKFCIIYINQCFSPEINRDPKKSSIFSVTPIKKS